jgi:hypothetical protein
MNEARKTPQIDLAARPRARRRAAGIVAQYIHELSHRHPRPRQLPGTAPEEADMTTSRMPAVSEPAYSEAA